MYKKECSYISNASKIPQVLNVTLSHMIHSIVTEQTSMLTFVINKISKLKVFINCVGKTTLIPFTKMKHFLLSPRTLFITFCFDIHFGLSY